MPVTLDGPDRDLLDEAETASYLRIGAKTLKRMIDAGLFPQGVRISPGVVCWSALDLAVYREWMRMQSRMKESKAGEKLEGLERTLGDNDNP